MLPDPERVRKIDLIFAAKLQNSAYASRKKLERGEIQPTAHVMRLIAQTDADARQHLFLAMGSDGQV